LGQIGYYLSFASDPLGFVGERFDKYGDIYYAATPDGHLFVLKHPDHLREVLATRSSKYRKKHTGLDRLSEVLGEGLVTSDGELWKRHRRMIQPAFHRARLAEYSRAMTDEALRMAADWNDGAVVDVSREMMELTLRVVCRTLFNHDVSGETDEVARVMSAFHNSLLRPDLLPSWVPSRGRKRLARATEKLDTIIYSMIDERRRSIEGGEQAPTDLLQMLVTAVDEDGDGAGLTEQEVRDELITMFLAGHETTSHALTWTLHLLSGNPRAATALREEVDGVLGDRAPTVDDLEALPWTEQVIKESMRLYPPVYMVARRAAEDTEIGEYRVPAGSEVVCWIYMTHRDSRWYPWPNLFRPERFAADEVAKLPKMAYLPFGGGPRACIGAQFALMEARLILATLVQRWDFDAVPGHRVVPKLRITMHPENGVQMRIRRR
jgi:cytochrome P450